MMTSEPPPPDNFHHRLLAIHEAAKRGTFIVAAMKATEYPILPNMGTLELAELYQAVVQELQRRIPEGGAPLAR